MLDRFLYRVFLGAVFLGIVTLTIWVGLVAWRVLQFMGMWN